MLTGTQKGIMSDAMMAVGQSSIKTTTIADAIADPFAANLAGINGIPIDTASVHVLYVQIFAKGDGATSADYKQFMTAARLVADSEQWNSYRLDDRWSNLSASERGPSELTTAAENTGASGAWESIKSGVTGASRTVLFGALAVILLLVVVYKRA